MTTVAERAVGAVVGGLVADAAAMPLHLMYDIVIKLNDVVGDRPDPEFLPTQHCRFYRIPTGRNSYHGDHAYVLLKSLAQCKGFDKADYKKRLYEAVGPNSEYEGTLGRPPSFEDLPVYFPWRTKNMTKFLEEYEEDNEETGIEQPVGDGLAIIAAVAALYAGRPELESVVREAVSITQSNKVAVQAAIAGAKILEHYILNGPSPDALPTVAKSLEGDYASYMSEAMDAKDKNHKEIVKEFGNSQDLPGLFKSAVHCVIKSDGDYVNTVRMDLVATGENCCRLNFIGAALGAQVGIGNIPTDWISKTDVAVRAQGLAENLVACRPSKIACD